MSDTRVLTAVGVLTELIRSIVVSEIHSNATLKAEKAGLLVPPGWLKRKEAAERLGCGCTKLHLLAKSGQIPLSAIRRIGKTPLYSIAWIDSNQSAVCPAPL